MKRIAIAVLCALALVSCKKNNFTVSSEYRAYMFLSEDSFSGIVGDDIPAAKDYFDEQIKQFNGVPFFAQTFSGEDSQSEEYAYQQADIKAVEYVAGLREKAMEKYDEILNTIQKTDIGGGKIKCTFTYSFERPGRPIDYFDKEITYDGGNRIKSDEVMLALFGSAVVAQQNVRIPGFDPECTVTCAGGVKLCLPDNTYADESTYGQMVIVNEIKLIEDGDEKCHVADMSIVVDEAHMANVKSKIGTWHALVPVVASIDGEQMDFIVYIPINIK